MKKSLIRRITVFFLALCMTLTEGHLSYLGNALGLGKGVETAYAAFEEDENLLYNFVHVNASGQYGLLRRTEFHPNGTLADFDAKPRTNGKYQLTDEDTGELIPYDFSHEVLHLNGKNSTARPYNGVYIYVDDINDYLVNPSDYNNGEIDGYYYVMEEGPVYYFPAKIGGSGFGHVIPENDFNISTGRKSYHRDYLISVVKGLPEPQTLYNFLAVKGTAHTTNMYRLGKTSTINYLPAEENQGFSIKPSQKVNDTDYNLQLYRRLCPESGEYDFTDVVLEMTSGGLTLSYEYKSADYEPDSEYFEPYYKVTIDKLCVLDTVNHDPDWFADPNGWLDGDGSEWSDVTSNDDIVYHRDYIATLYHSDKSCTVLWKNDDGSTLETDNNVVGGTKPHYDSPDPSKASDELYDYIWYGWVDEDTNEYGKDEDLPIVSDTETVYTAVYRAVPKYASLTGYVGAYDKESHSITVELQDGVEAAVEYSVKNANGSTWSAWSATAPAETDVCDKLVRVRVTYNELATEVPDPVALKITKATATVTVTGHNDISVFDGEEHSVTGYDISSSNPVYTQDDFTYTGTQSAARTDVGTTQMGLTSGTFTNTNENFENVSFSVTDGYQTITQYEDEIVVTITGHNSTTDYDGEEHSVSGYEVSVNNDLYTAADFTFSGTAEAKRTDAGTTSMGLTASMFTNNNANFDNDKITFNVIDGYQKIDPINVTVTITGNNSTDDYDGEEHTVTGYTAAANSTLYNVNSDITFTGTAEASRTNFGTTNMGLTSNMFANNNPNFGTVTFEVTDGYQTIDKIDVTVTITGANSACDYDGAEHSVSGYTAVFSSPLYTEADFTFSGTAEAARTNAGTSNMGLAADQFTNTNTNFNTVTFNVTDGYQTINPLSGVTVTITGHNSTTDYDGEEHSVSGYDVEIGNALYTENDFTFSGTNLINRTDAGTTNMDLTVDQFTNTNDNFEGVTFVIAADGYLTINSINVTVTITGRNNATDYDGDSHSVSGYEVEISNDLYAEADFTFSGTAEASRTDAGTTYMGLAADQFTNTNTNFATVTFDVTDGYQTINPIDVTVTITGANNSCAYDGEEHTVTGYTATADSDLYDVDNDFVFSGTAQAARTEAGTTNMGLAADQFENTNSNFGTVTFNVTDGYQTINTIDVTVTITGHNNTTDFDGNSHSVSGYDVEISNPLYTVADFTFSGTAEAARTDAGTTEMGLAEDQFTNTNDNFGTVTFNVTDGYQTINPINVTVTVTGHSDSSVYDGNDHSVSGYDLEFSTDLYTEADFTFSGNAAATQQNVGKTNMGLAADQFTNTNTNFATVTFNVTDGYQQITQLTVEVTITGHTDEVTYDGSEHTVAGFEFESTSDLFTVNDLSVNMDPVEAKATDAGTYPMGLSESIFRAESPNFAVTINVTDGSLKINPAEITITADPDQGKVYDNDESTDPELTATVTDIPANGIAPVYTVTRAAGQDAGQYEITVTAEAESNPNYTIAVVGGSFSITPAEITISAVDKEKVYDNDASTDPGLTAEVTGLPANGAAPVYSLTRAEGQDAGEYGISVNYSAEANSNYTISVQDGTFTITPAEITIAAENKGKVYDNDETTDPELTAEVTGLPENGVEPTYSIDRDEGQDAGTYTISVNFEAEANPNYTISVEPGTFTISPAEITITAQDKEKVYDNDASTDPELTAEVTGLPENGAALVYDISRTEGQEVGTYAISVNAEAQSNPNYTISTVPGTFTITSAAITVLITGHTDEKTYDGTEQSVSGYDFALSEADAEIFGTLYTLADFTCGGNDDAARTDAGTTEMGLTADDFHNENRNFAVTFAVTDGSITITPAEITISAVDKEKVYDNDASTDPELTATVSDMPENGVAPVYTLSREAGQDAADYEINVLVVADDNPNYTFNTNAGTFTITKAPVTITPVDKSKEYDNDPNTDPELTATVTGLIGDDSIAYSMERVGGQDVGEYQISVLIGTDYQNYEITTEYGTFEITKKTIRITADPKNKVFDNDASTDPELTATVEGLPENGIAPVYSLSREAGQDVGNYTITVTVQDDANPNYEITPVNGTFAITKLEGVTVTIKGNTDTKTYDGEDHSVSGYTVESISSELYSAADFTFGREGGVTVTRKDAGTTEMGLTEDDFRNENNNFDVTFVVTDGSITIEPKEITVKANDQSKTYDKNAATDPELTATVTDAVEGDAIAYTLSREEGQDVDEYIITVSVEEGANPNYIITTENGTFTIEPATLSFSIDDKTKVYDNDETTDPELTGTVIGLVDGDEYELVLARDEGQDAGEYTIRVLINEIDNYVFDDSATGIFKITPAAVTIKADDKSKTYDNDETTDPELTVTMEGLIEGDNIPYGIHREEGQDAGEYAIIVDLLAAEEIQNYTVTGENGTFKINPAEITITAGGKTKVYDNDPSTDPELTATVTGTPDNGVAPVYSLSREAGQDVGNYTITVTVAQDESNKNYEITPVNGTFAITKLEGVTVTIKGNTDMKTYDGEDHTVSGYTVESISSELYTEADFTFGRENGVSVSRKDAGTTEMGLTEEDFRNENNNFDVTFVVTDGSITIEPAAITISADDTTKTYDNDASTDPELTATVSDKPANGVTPVYTLSREAGQDAKGYTITVAVEEEANPNYVITVEEGIFTIAPAEITISAVDKEKVYDNDASTDPELTATVSDMPENGVAPVYTLSREAGQDAADYEINVLVVADDNPNYTFNTNAGTFTITKAPVTITPVDKSKEYDNDPNTDPELTATVTGLIGDDSIAYSMERVGGQDVGEYQISVLIGTDYQNYEITTEYGTFEITKKTIRITADPKNKVFDNDASTDPELTATVEGLPENGIAPVYSLSREAGQDVGNYTITVNVQDDVNPNYEITSENGTFTINHAEATVTPQAVSKVYDNDETTDPELTAVVSGTIADETITYTLSREAGQNAGEYTITASAEEGANPNYTVNFGTAVFTIEPKAITVKADDKSKTYDKNAATDPELTATVTDAVEGDQIVYSLSREAGQTVNEYVITVSVEEGANPNYIITTDNGLFTIEPAELSFTVDNKEKVYDNDASTDPELTGTVVGLVDGDEYNLEFVRDEGQDAGEYTIHVVINEIENYTFDDSATGIFKITPAAVTIKADDKSKTYDNDETTDPELTVTMEGLIEGDNIPYGIHREEGQDAGEYAIIVDLLAAEEIQNYTVTGENGTFKINPAEITITAGGKTKVYDNDPSTDPELTATVTGTPDNGVAPVYSLSREAGQNVGEYTITVTAEDDANPNYNVSFESGIFAITPIAVTVTPQAVSKVYDNDETTDPELTAVVSGTIADETITYTLSREAGQNAGEYSITASAEEGANPNYTVTFGTAVFTINPAAITIKADDMSKTYDKNDATDPELTAKITGIPANGVAPVYSLSREAGQDAAEYDISINVTADDNPNYTVTVENGIFKINKKDLTVTAVDKTKVYDNDASTDPNLTVEMEGLVDGDEVNTIITRAEGQDVSEYEINVVVAETSNYNVTVVKGTFKITPAAITIKAEDKNKVYDNNASTDPELTATVTGAVEGDEIVYTLNREAGQNVGEYQVTPSAQKDDNPNYTVTFENGTFKITPKAVTVKAEDKSKDYDNNPDNDPELTATVTGAVAGDEISYELSREEGQNVGEYVITVTAEDGANPNYNVTFENAVFKITAIDVTVTITGHNAVAVYNNTEHNVNGYDAAFSSDLYTEADFTFKGTAEAKLTNAGTAYMGLTEDMFQNTNTNFGKVTFVIEEDGYITVNKAAITVTIKGNDDVKTFDNTEHLVTGYTASTDCEFYDVDKDFTCSGTAVAKRKDAGITVMGLTADMFTNTNENFDVTFDVTDGQMWITEVDEVVVKIKGHKFEGSYDATEKNVSGYDVEISNDLYSEDDIDFSGKAEVSGKNAGKVSMGLDAEQFTNTNPNFKKVTFIIEEDGFVEISPAEITVTADDITITEGDAEPQLTISADLFSDDTIEFEIKREAGTEPGEYIITVTGAENQGNYHITSFINGKFTIAVKVFYYLKAPTDLTWTHNTLTVKEFEFARNVDDHTTIEHSAGFKIDGNVVPEGTYTVRAGSVIISLKPEYLQTLAIGKHTIEALFDDGDSVTTEFTIVEQKDVNPSTGDEFEADKLMMLMLGSAACFIVLLLRRRKEEAEA